VQPWRRYSIRRIESATLEALRARLRNPDLLREFVLEYHAERRRMAAATAGKKTLLQREMSDVTGRIHRMVEAIASGLSEVGTIKQALLDLEIRRGQLAAKLAEPASDEQVISLHPAALDRYLGDIETLQATLERDREISGSAHAQLRSLVQSVVVHPVPAGAPLDIEITGYLANLLHAPQLPPNGRYRAGGNDGSGGRT
jgi:site-specific DNA recombinase